MALLSLSQFVAKYSGKFVEYHSFDPRAKNQCVDLVNQYFVDVWGVPAIIGADAVDFPSKIKPPLQVVEETPDTIPEIGWVVVFKKWGSLYGTPGHIGVVVEGTDINNLYVFEQNYPTGSPCVTNRHNYRGVLCYIKNTKVPTTQGTMSKELEVCLADRKKFWEERDAARKQLEAVTTELGTEKRSKSQIVSERDRLKDVTKEASRLLEAEITTPEDFAKALNAWYVREHNREVDLINKEKEQQAPEKAKEMGAKEAVYTLVSLGVGAGFAKLYSEYPIFESIMPQTEAVATVLGLSMTVLTRALDRAIHVWGKYAGSRRLEASVFGLFRK